MRHAVLGNVLWPAIPITLALSTGSLDHGELAASLLLHGGFLLILTRLGFLAGIGDIAADRTISALPRTLRSSDWKVTSSALVVLALLALIARITWAYRTAVAGRSAFADGEALPRALRTSCPARRCST